MPSQESQQVLEFVKSQYVELGDEFSFEQIRQGFETSMQAIPIPEGTQVEATSAGGVPADWVRMSGVAADRVLLYLHGGAYTLGSARSHRELAARLSQAAGVQVLVPTYRLAPEHPFPAGLEDALAAYRWLISSGFEPEHIAIGGDSAGGGLTLATLLSLREAGDKLPAATILLSPWTDLTSSGDSCNTRAETDPIIKVKGAERHIKAYVGEGDRAGLLVSPVFADLHGLPPMLIQVGDYEVLLDDSTRVAHKVKEAGGEVELKVWEGMWHVFQASAMMVPEARQAVSELGEFVHKHLFVKD